MLVLSRRESESVHFPELDIQIEVLKIKGSKVRLGIQAPLEISVFRGELEPQKKLNRKILVSAKDEHAIRNKLNELSVAMGLARRLIQRSKFSQAANTLEKALKNLNPKNEIQEMTELVDGIERRDNDQISSCLLVEDVANEREMLAGFLRLHGYHVDTARDGIEAVEFLENSAKPDFMLVDMNLPRMHGTEAVKLIRANPAFDPVQIFAMSGNAPTDLGFDVVENRIQHWFQKPLQPNHLIALMHHEMAAMPL